MLASDLAELLKALNESLKAQSEILTRLAAAPHPLMSAAADILKFVAGALTGFLLEHLSSRWKEKRSVRLRLRQIISAIRHAERPDELLAHLDVLRGLYSEWEPFFVRHPENEEVRSKWLTFKLLQGIGLTHGYWNEKREAELEADLKRLKI